MEAKLRVGKIDVAEWERAAYAARTERCITC
jgi:hypothetical protein